MTAEPDDLIEIFIAGLMLMGFGSVAIYLWSPETGEYLFDVLPSIVEVAVYVLVVLIFASIILKKKNAISAAKRYARKRSRAVSGISVYSKDNKKQRSIKSF